MKKTIIAYITIALLIPIFHSCKPSEKRLNQKAIEVAYSILQDSPVDSIKVIEIQKVTAMKYAEIVLEMMEAMEYDYDNRYEYAMEQGDIDMAEKLRLEQETVTEMKEYCFVNITNNTLNDKETLLYLVYIVYFEKDYSEDLYFLMTPKFELHELDPFGDNLIK